MEIGEGDMVSVHFEACDDPHKVLADIKSRGADPCIAISPDTPVEVVNDFLDEVYAVLLMTVYPGFAGQPMAPKSMERLSQLKEIVDKSGKDVPVYGFVNTRASLDLARMEFEKVKDLTIRLSMIENAAYRLAYNIKKTQKRANSLQNITIPGYDSLTRNISNALEEKEREEFTRLKVIKERIS
jgi:pentose-5-phosphate-3-epimerase